MPSTSGGEQRVIPLRIARIHIHQLAFRQLLHYLLSLSAKRVLDEHSDVIGRGLGHTSTTHLPAAARRPHNNNNNKLPALDHLEKPTLPFSGESSRGPPLAPLLVPAAYCFRNNSQEILLQK